MRLYILFVCSGQALALLSGGQSSRPASIIRGAAKSVLDVKMQVDQMGVLKTSINDLNSRLGAGGEKSRDALIRLISLATEPNAKAVMKNGGIEGAAARLMQSPQSSVELQVTSQI